MFASKMRSKSALFVKNTSRSVNPFQQQCHLQSFTSTKQHIHNVATSSISQKELSFLFAAPTRSVSNFASRDFHQLQKLLKELKDDAQDMDNKLPSTQKHNNFRDYYDFVQRDVLYILDRARDYSIRMWLTIIGTTCIVVFLSWDVIIGFFSATGADVANRSLENEELMKNLTESLKKVTNDALQHPDTIAKLVELVKSLLTQPETKVIVMSFLLSVLSDPNAQAATKEFFSYVLKGLFADQTTQQYTVEFLKVLLKDPAFQTQAVDLVKYIIGTPNVQTGFVDLLKWVMADDNLRNNYAVPFVKQVLASDEVRQQFSNVSINAVHDVMDNQNVKRHAVEFVKEVLDNQQVHAKGGNALWEVIKNAFVPSWFSGAEKAAGITVPPTSTAAVVHAAAEHQQQHKE